MRAALAERAATTMGRERAKIIHPTADAARIERELAEVEDALFGANLNLGGITDVRHLYERAFDGKVLAGSELLEVAYTLDAAMTLRRSIFGNSRGPLRDVAIDIGEHSAIVRRTLESLDRDGAVRDDASPKLRQIRRRLNPLRGEIREKLSGLLERFADVLQENLVTIRRDRYVIPIKASSVNSVAGIIVDQSATGQTYFVEPAAITPLNNELARLQLEEEAEVRRILLELSGMIASDASILVTLSTLAALDLIAAKARLARDWRLNKPERAESGCFDLREARHPLIENAVPNDLQLGETQMLLITGPNMGGKTATLKTLGLATVMHQCGMYVSAARAKLPVVRDLLVDIGDEQSIEASLSTFAAHLKNLRHVLEQADRDTLVLIDELGSGTDPAEGAALARAMLEQLLAQDARGIVTSHLAPLKLFALETSGLRNASMGFDLERLAPTYQLQVGQPGRSFALAIARRMGLPESITVRADEVLGPEGGQLERLLEELERERGELRRELDTATNARRKAEAELAKVKDERADLQARQDEILAEAQKRAEVVYAEALDQVRTLRARAKEDSARPRVMEELRQLRRSAQAEARPPAPEPKGDPIRPGSTVDVPAYGSSGQVLEVRGDELVVQLGVMKINVRRRDVRLRQEEKVKVASGFNGMAPKTFERELQLRGSHVEEAIEELRDAIAEASALRETPLRVVHGKGQGVLRRLIRDYLKTDKRVASFHDAEPYQGGHGVTVVNLKV